MPFTFADLVSQLQPILWPMGESENLVVPHRAMMVEALVDLQTWVECLQVNNTQIVPACDTLFKCGYTVVDWPRGRIKRLYTIDKINQITGKEDATQPTDWCSIVDYRQVEYADLDRYISETLAKAWGGGLWGWCGLTFGALAGIFAFPDCWMSKYDTYPPPDDAGLATAPPLPLGYHYQQPSTDAKFRAQWGMWAIRGGQIFIGPWIQSTETIVIEWDGIKRAWADQDIVDQDPNLIKAVEWYVRWQHALKYDHDYSAAQAAEVSYNEVRGVLIHECQEETEVRRTSESKARGATTVVPTFSNAPQTATAQCSGGTTGQPVTQTVPAGTVTSTISQSDADAKAKSLALQQAGAQLVCTPVGVTYLNAAQTAVVPCPQGSDGFTVSVTTPAGTISSQVSQLDADTQAYNQALAQATAELVCTFVNTQQSFTAVCGSNPANNRTVTIAPGIYSSTLSQADANSQALAAATVQANAAMALVCSGATVFTNTQQNVPVTYACAVPPGGVRTLSVTIVVQAGKFSSQVSQQDANQQAINYGNTVGLAELQAQCRNLQPTGPVQGPGGGIQI